jgi:hypothetical protein
MQLGPFRGTKQLRRAAAILLAAMHLLLAVAPHTVPAAATRAHAHLHAAGDQLELPHDETACLACTRDVITGAARITSAPSLIWASSIVRSHVPEGSRRNPLRFISAQQSRAPPSLA